MSFVGRYGSEYSNPARIIPAQTLEPFAGRFVPGLQILHAARTLIKAFFRQRPGLDAGDLYAQTHGQVDQLLLTLVLEYAQGNLQQEARILRIARQILRLKLRELGLYVKRSAEVEDDDQ